MASLNYDDIYSRFYGKVEAFDLLFEDIEDEVAEDLLSGWLRSSVAYPYIRRLFKTVSFNENRGIFTYELRYTLDDVSDEEFVIELLANGIVYFWLEPKVKSITNIMQTYATSEQKFYSESKHLEELRALLADSESRIRSMIRDRGYLYNSYLDGGT